MRIPKRYGQSKTTTCPFCDKLAIAQNAQKVPTCLQHKANTLPDMKCACGSWLDLRVSKYGPYFNCFSCGNVNWRKAMEINGPLQAQPIEKKQKSPAQKTRPKQYNTQKHTGTITSRPSTNSYGYAKVESKNKKEVVIRSDEVDFI